MLRTSRSHTLPKHLWILRETDPSDAARRMQALSEDIGCSPLLARVLLARGLDSGASARSYLNPGLDQIRPPGEIPGLEEARDRLLMAIRNGEPVLVHGDYDVDGIVGAVILHLTLKELDCPSRIFLPRRDVHGFGLALQSIEKAKESSIRLIVSVDCGISSPDSVRAATDAGIEVIVTDHHPLPQVLPEGAILVHPDLHADHPGGKIAGATVSFKLCLAILEALGRDADEARDRFLPLIALATVADVCPLTGENRALVALGLPMIPSTEFPGLRVLFEGSRRSGDTGPLSERDIAFGMAPCMNAAGRMGDPFPAAKLLLAKDPDTAWRHFRTLDRLNRERKRIQSEICSRLMSLPEVAWAKDEGVLVLVDENCTPGLAGLAASRIAEQTGRPTCILAPSGDTGGPLYRGSMRTRGSEDLIELMEPAREPAHSLGGHPSALGVTVRPERLDDFMHACRGIPWTSKPTELTLDFEIANPPVSAGEVIELDRTRPWGRGNPQPAFVWGPVVIEQTRAVGRDLEHVQFALQGKDGKVTKGIGFSLASSVMQLDATGKSARAAGHFTINTWQGNSAVEFELKDIQVD